MQLTRCLSAAALGGSVLLLGLPASAGVEEHGAGLRFELFADSDDVHVFSTGSDYEVALEGQARLFLSWLREIVVVPGVSSPAGSQEALDAISGASRPVSSGSDPFADFRKTRNQLDLHTEWRGVNVRYYLSDETDYFAQQVGGGVTRSLLADNVELALGASYGWDRIEPLEDDVVAPPDDFKNAFHWSAVATTVVSPTTLVQAGLESTNVSGLQHNPYRAVYVAGAYEAERHPDRRDRVDGFLKVNQYLPNRSSLNTSYKYYRDDWGIDSHTLGAKLHQYVTESVVVRYRYRYYTQSSADFFRDEYTQAGGVDGFQTGDYRMGAFDAHLFGTRITWDLGHGPFAVPALNGIRATLKYERYFNSNNFSANIFESGLSLSF